MIIRLETNRAEFSPIDFHPGFNAIVADRAKDATAQDSRNARGKSTILMFINWVLASNKPAALKPLGEDGWSISLTLEMFGGVVKATRDLGSGTRLLIESDEPASAIIRSYLTEGTVSLEDWKELLGLALFRLEPPPEGSKGGPSVRTLLSYVVRLEAPKDPLKILSQQSATSSRVHVAFLMGLDWRPVQELADIKKGLAQITAITAATREGLFSTLRPENELLLERAAVKSEIEDWQGRVQRFRVLEDPNELVERANFLAGEIAALRDEAIVDARMHDMYEASLSEEVAQNALIDAETVATVMQAADVILADGFKKRMDEVEAFHTALLSNRRSFLTTEIDQISTRIAERSRRLAALSAARQSVHETLHAGGALDELLGLQAGLAEAEGRLSTVDEQIEQARDIVSKRAELKLKKEQRKAVATEMLSSSRGRLDVIADRFSSAMKRLNGRDAVLTAAVDDGGYKFALRVSGANSTGVTRAMLLCFDLTLLEEGVRTQHHPDFLIHDSTVFDGVDPRQRTGAMRFANEVVESTGGQYICTINSNDIPDDVLAEPWFRVVRTILDTEAHGAIGISF